MEFNILHIDARRDDARAAVAGLRRRLSQQGNLVPGIAATSPTL